MRVAVYCAACLARIALPAPVLSREGEAPCPRGHGAIAYRHSDAVASSSSVDLCSRCAATAFFVEKDFDQRLGCALLALGAVLALLVSRLFGGVWFVPALLLFAGLELLVARRVGSVVICYRCDTEYRGVPDAAAYKPYDPHVAERYAELKTVRRMNP
jgi:hypothetical protein